MKMIVVVALALVAAAAAAPAAPGDNPAEIKILKSEFKQEDGGAFVSSFETENGIKSEQVGETKTVRDEDNKEVKVLVIRGSYEYPGEDGPVLVTYTADETGYHAFGESIPKGPDARR